MALLAASSPVPISLDEELIGYNTPEKKKELLSFINPQYIILKPSLHGGLYGCSEWIKEAQDRQIGWWITSALESNVGLNAIAQLSTVNCQLSEFISDWKSASPYLEVQTSGSTGTPKRIMVRKEQMVNSARLTCDYLGLRQGDKALLCMPLRYIAGKMMVVRSLVAGLDLVIREPSGHPMADIDMPLRFAAMIS